MGLIFLPCRACESRVDCLAEEQKCKREFITLFDNLRFLMNYNPGWVIIFLSFFGLTGSSIVWFFEFFERLSVKLLLSSSVLFIAGILLAIVAEFAKDKKAEHDKKMRKNEDRY